jgi:response regulator NasT
MTYFTVPDLPPAQPPPDDAAPDVSPGACLAGLRAVVVEDEGLTVWQLRRLLTRVGITIVGEAADGAAGVALVLRERPDLVLMDIRMPVLDGLSATRQLLSQLPVCVVMVSAYTEYRDEARAAGASGYLSKPFGPDLVAQLDAAYRRFQQRDL